MGSSQHGERLGDAEMMASIEAVYLDRFTQFHRVATGITGDSELGRDSVQEAFARAICHRREYRGEGSLEGWLWRTLVNVARDQCRAGKRIVPCADPPEPTERFSAASYGPPDLAVRGLIARLPERQRLALFLRYYCDMSYAGIGAVLGIRTGTVSATLNAAHRSLRSALDQDRLPQAEPGRMADGDETTGRRHRAGPRATRNSERLRTDRRRRRIERSPG